MNISVVAVFENLTNSNHQTSFDRLIVKRRKLDLIEWYTLSIPNGQKFVM